VKTIYKYAVNVGHNPVIKIPKGAVFLDVQTQGPNQNISVWALIDTSQPLVDYGFHVVGTGHQIPDTAGVGEHNYIGTFQTSGGAFVWHVFGGEVKAVRERDTLGDAVTIGATK